MAELSPEEREKAAEALLRKADTLLRLMRATAESECPERIDEEADSLLAVLTAREFPAQRASDYRNSGKALQAQAHQRAVSMLFTEAERKARSGDESGRNELLLKVKDHFVKALRYGAGEECRRMVERRVDALMLTTKEGVDERTKLRAQQKLSTSEAGAAPREGGEHRRANRYVAPTLTVVIDGVSYTTVNWSIRGLLVEPYRPDSGLVAGDRVRVRLSCAGITAGGRQAAKVVRVVPRRQAVALDFSGISTVVLSILHALKDAGIRPEIER